MQRPIKFRVWDNLKKIWILNKRIFTEPDRYGVYLKQHEQGYIFQQFTGLKDETGREIYEGDILEFDETQIGGSKGIGEILYSTDMTLFGPCFCMWVIDAESKSEGQGRNGFSTFPFGGKVIGNIFENKELIIS